jgi:hypothetical protein
MDYVEIQSSRNSVVLLLTQRMKQLRAISGEGRGFLKWEIQK